MLFSFKEKKQRLYVVKRGHCCCISNNTMKRNCRHRCTVDLFPLIYFLTTISNYGGTNELITLERTIKYDSFTQIQSRLWIDVYETIILSVNSTRAFVGGRNNIIFCLIFSLYVHVWGAGKGSLGFKNPRSARFNLYYRPRAHLWKWSKSKSIFFRSLSP